MTFSMVLAGGKPGAMPLHMFHLDHLRIHHA